MARDANSKVFKVSPTWNAAHCEALSPAVCAALRAMTCSKAGFTQTSKAVRQLPPMEPSKILARQQTQQISVPKDAEGPKKYKWDAQSFGSFGSFGMLWLLVSLLSRRGTCDFRAAKALTTFLGEMARFTRFMLRRYDFCLSIFALADLAVALGSKCGLETDQRRLALCAVCFWIGFWAYLSRYATVVLAFSTRFQPCSSVTRWASRRPVGCDWCWSLPEIACPRSQTSSPLAVGEWIKMLSNRRKYVYIYIYVYIYLCLYMSIIYIFIFKLFISLEFPQSCPIQDIQVTRSEPARSTTLSLRNSLKNPIAESLSNKKSHHVFSAQHCDLLLWICFAFFAEFIAIKIAVDICWYLVGGWALPLWKMMEFVSRDDYYNLIPNCFWKVIIQPCSSHHQPVINHH